MTSAPAGAHKADAENSDAVANAKADAKAKETTQKKATTRRKATTGSYAANPEAVSKPGDEQAPAKVDKPTPTGEPHAPSDPDGPQGEAQFEVPPAAPGPNDPVEEGVVEIKRKAEEGEPSDPAGLVTVREKTGSTRGKKKDKLKDIDLSKLPVAVAVGQVTASVEEYAGNAVLSLSLVGWVGDAPMKIRADDIDELMGALDALRNQL